MRRWDELGKVTKALVAIVLVLLAIAVPEIGFLMMMGGVDLTWLVLLSFVAPLFAVVRGSVAQVIEAIRACATRSLLARPPVFAMSVAVSLVAFLVSGSLLASLLSLALIAVPY